MLLPKAWEAGLPTMLLPKAWEAGLPTIWREAAANTGHAVGQEE
jgi:hypothetical protein